MYLPAVPARARVDCGEIARATYDFAFRKHPEISNDRSVPGSASSCDLILGAQGDSAEIRLSGSVPRARIEATLGQGLRERRFVEAVIQNHPGNVAVQESLLESGWVALGVMPGVRYEVGGAVSEVPTTIHYGMLRPEIRSNLADVELAKDYDGTPIPALVARLMEEWRRPSTP